jgi:hypothetical protein
MTSTMRAIKTTGILTTQGQIQLDYPLPQDKPRRVIDHSDCWNERDKTDMTNFAMQYSASLFSDEETI